MGFHQVRSAENLLFEFAVGKRCFGEAIAVIGDEYFIGLQVRAVFNQLEDVAVFHEVLIGLDSVHNVRLLQVIYGIL